MGDIFDGIGDILGGIGDFIGDAIGGIVDFVGDAIGGIMDGGFMSVLSLGMTMMGLPGPMSMLWDGISSAAGALGEGISGFLSKIGLTTATETLSGGIGMVDDALFSESAGGGLFGGGGEGLLSATEAISPEFAYESAINAGTGFDNFVNNGFFADDIATDSLIANNMYNEEAANLMYDTVPVSDYAGGSAGQMYAGFQGTGFFQDGTFDNAAGASNWIGDKGMLSNAQAIDNYVFGGEYTPGVPQASGFTGIDHGFDVYGDAAAPISSNPVVDLRTGGGAGGAGGAGGVGGAGSLSSPMGSADLPGSAAAAPSAVQPAAAEGWFTDRSRNDLIAKLLAGGLNGLNQRELAEVQNDYALQQIAARYQAQADMHDQIAKDKQNRSIVHGQNYAGTNTPIDTGSKLRAALANVGPRYDSIMKDVPANMNRDQQLKELYGKV